MGLKLYYSSHTEKLAEQLGASLADRTHTADPFASPVVIVPNTNLKLWLQLRIATQNSVAANIRFTFLESGLWDLIATLDPEKGTKSSILTKETYLLLILGELFSMRADDKDLSPVWKYLHDKDGKKVTDYDRKAWQLSEKLEKCFREYEYKRAEMITAWMAGGNCYDKGSLNQKKMETCQRVLYTRIFSLGGSRDRLCEAEGRMYLTLPQYMRRIFRTGAKLSEAKNSSGPIYIFGLSQISVFHTELLFEAGKYFDIRLYQINVCSEFWEDIDTPQEKNFRKFKKIAILDNDDGEYLKENTADNRLLRLWGKPGRENVKLLSELEERCSGKVEFDTDWTLSSEKPKKKMTMLEAVQDHILHRIDESVTLKQDTSIQIAGSPGVYREVETVHNSIISNMKNDPTLKLTDIAVLVPGMAAYKPAIKTVFSRSPRLIPFNMTDSVASDDSVFAQGFLALFDLVESSFTRHKVFSLVLNDCFLAATRTSREAALIWLKWADGLGIFHSFDKEDKARRGYVSNDRYTWRQGLMRLRFGKIMEKDDASDASAELRNYKAVVPFSDMDSENTALVSDFSLIVETLMARICMLTEGPRSSADWARDIGSVVDEFLKVPRDKPKEERIYNSIKRSLESLAGCDAVFGELPDKRVEFGFAREYLTASLAEVTSGHGKYLAGGVTISSLLPMRPIPFRIVYVMGLGEGNFPGSPDRSALDIRNYRRKIGDVSMQEADRYLFLETLMSVREKLYLTYVSQDTEKDKPFHPCSVVNELRGYLEEKIIRDKFKTLKTAFSGWQDDIPLKGSSAKYLADTESVSQWSDILATFSVPDRLSCLMDLNKSGALKLKSAQESEVEKKRSELTKWSMADEVKADEEAPPDETQKITLRDLEKFLINPVEAALVRHLAIYDREAEDLLEVEDEPFVANYFITRELITGLVKWFIPAWYKDDGVKGSPWECAGKRFDEYYAYRQMQGKAPDEAFGDVDGARTKRIAEEIIMCEDGILDFLKARGGATLERNVSFGRSFSSSESTKRYEPVKLDLKRAAGKPSEIIELHGDLPFLWEDSGGGYQTIVVITGKARTNEKLSRAILKPILFYLMLRASGQSDGKSAPLSVFVAGQSGVSLVWRMDISSSEAAKYLKELVTDYLDSGSFDHLPFELVKTDINNRELVDNPSKMDEDMYRDSLEERIEEDTDNNNKKFAKYRPTDLVTAIGPAVPEDAYKKVIRRFKWLSDRNTAGIKVDKE